jgi:sulfite exporter TauE/SafE
VDASHSRGEVTVCRTNDGPSAAQIHTIIRQQGYGTASGMALGNEQVASWPMLAGAFIVAVGILWLLDSLHLTALAPSATQGLSLSGALIIGLVAGTSSCLAVVGGFILAIAGRLNTTKEQPFFTRIEPMLQFNIGRLLSYFVLGAAIGLIGQSVGFGITSTAVLSIIVAVVMLWLGLSQLGVTDYLPLPTLPKSVSHRIAALSDSPHPAAPFALGALTFFLPCGFTQSMQLVALASGNPITGGMLMFFFALGTMPSLLGLSVLSTYAKDTRFTSFLKPMTAMLVILLGLLNLQSGLTLLGAPISLPSFAATTSIATAPAAVGEVQNVAMTVTPYGSYDPDVLTVKAGIPVKWTIDGTNAQGCTSGIVVPSLGIRQNLHRGDNVITFTPTTPGQIAFSCSMGMVRGSFNVL